jgi:hypothetical protein
MQERSDVIATLGLSPARDAEYRQLLTELNAYRLRGALAMALRPAYP